VYPSFELAKVLSQLRSFFEMPAISGKKKLSIVLVYGF
jgi:hypothetical protein